MRKINFDKMEPGPEMDYLVGVKVMGFMTAKYFKDGAGCYPANAKPIYAATCWGTTSKGGTYPFITKNGTLFEQKGSGRDWQPSWNMADAWLVVDQLDLFKRMKIGRPGPYRIEAYARNGTPYCYATGVSASHAICRAALLMVVDGKVPA